MYSKLMNEDVTLYAIDNDNLWDLYMSKSGLLVAIPCDPTSGRQECYFGNAGYLKSYERKFGVKHSYVLNEVII